jgi:RimJ/RimL family protein N-acetyltransferase
MAEAEGQVVVETERLVLRRELPGDLAIWLEHMNTPRVLECTGGVKTVDEVKDAFAKMAAAADAGEPTFHFVALRPDGPLIGKCGLSPIDSAVAPDELRGAVQVGWSLRADCWGKGYAREAAQAAFVLAFERFDLPRIYAQTSERNAASWGLMERLGMRRRADLDYPDPEYPPEDNPTMVYAITRDEWQAMQ